MIPVHPFLIGQLAEPANEAAHTDGECLVGPTDSRDEHAAETGDDALQPLSAVPGTVHPTERTDCHRIARAA
jgi:hypothetical protein